MTDDTVVSRGPSATRSGWSSTPRRTARRSDSLETNGCTPMRVAAPSTSTGTTASNALDGSTSSAAAPAKAPTALVRATRTTRGRTGASSRRYPHVPLRPPGTSPTQLLVFATSGERPSASRTGKLTRLPAPTEASTTPAPNPAARTASTSPGPTSSRPSVAQQRDVADLVIDSSQVLVGPL